MSRETASNIRALYLDGVKGAEIARRLGLTRQAVSYHLVGSKDGRRRALMSEAERARVNALARAAYHRRKP